MAEPDPIRFAAPGPDVLAVSGRLTFDTVAQAWRDGQSRLDASPAVLDLAAVEQVDSAGLAWVLALLASGRRRNPELRVVHAPESLRALAAVSDADAWVADQPL